MDKYMNININVFYRYAMIPKRCKNPRVFCVAKPYTFQVETCDASELVKAATVANADESDPVDIFAHDGKLYIHTEDASTRLISVHTHLVGKNETIADALRGETSMGVWRDGDEINDGKEYARMLYNEQQRGYDGFTAKCDDLTEKLRFYLLADGAAYVQIYEPLIMLETDTYAGANDPYTYIRSTPDTRRSNVLRLFLAFSFADLDRIPEIYAQRRIYMKDHLRTVSRFEDHANADRADRFARFKCEALEHLENWHASVTVWDPSCFTADPFKMYLQHQADLADWYAEEARKNLDRIEQEVKEKRADLADALDKQAREHDALEGYKGF